MKTSGFPSMPGRTALDAFALMDVSDSGISQRLLDHAAAQRHRSANLDGQPEAGRSKRPALRDVIERAEADAGSDEAYFLAQLRQVVAAFETPADRLRARYRQWPSGPAQFCGKRRDWADPRKRTARITGRLPGERQTASDSADAVRPANDRATLDLFHPEAEEAGRRDSIAAGRAGPSRRLLWKHGGRGRIAGPDRPGARDAMEEPIAGPSNCLR